MAEKRIFRYILEDAWGYTFSQLDIIKRDSGEGEARGLYYDSTVTYCDGTIHSSHQNIELSVNDIETISNVILDNDEIFDYGTLNSPGLILDGFINCFEFSSGGKKNKIIGYNLWAYRSDIYNKEKTIYTEKAERLLYVSDKIKGVLMDKGFEAKYMMLERK